MKKILFWCGVVLGSILILVLMILFYFSWQYGIFGSDYQNGGILSENQAKYDVKYYNINLAVDAKKEFLSGYTEISVAGAADLDILEFDLIDNYTIDNVEINSLKISDFTHRDNKLLIPLQNSFSKNEIVQVKIAYSGSPPIAKNPPWRGGFVWDMDDYGNDWVSFSCQGEGAKIWIPCKDHPSDEADSVSINITVPEEYYVASNGLLRETSFPESGYKTYHWFSGYPINNYLINFGIGKFEIVQKEYIALDGTKMPVIFYVLPHMRYGADDFLDKAMDMLYSYRKFFGEYPWVKEKAAFLNTPFAGMEHQTLISYGNEYKESYFNGLILDKLLLHELGHEWWGNKLTVNDWADFWIQEGICTYAEALYVLDRAGEAAYHRYMFYLSSHIRNRSPLISHKNSTADDSYSTDIYNKGAAFMHTLHYVLGDDVFFQTLKQFVTDSAYTFENQVVTNDLLQLVNKNSGQDWTDLFHLYLNTTDLPQIKIDSLTTDTYNVSIPNIDFELPMEVEYNGKTERLMLGHKPVKLVSDYRPLIDEMNWYLK